MVNHSNHRTSHSSWAPKTEQHNVTDAQQQYQWTIDPRFLVALAGRGYNFQKQKLEILELQLD
jgi:hypothetical protein